MQSQYKLFKQEKHPIEVDETYHIFSGANISNVVFWNFIYWIKIKQSSKISFQDFKLVEEER